MLFTLWTYTLCEVGRYEVLGWESSGGMQILASALYYGKCAYNYIRW